MHCPVKLVRHSGRKATNSILNAFVRAGDWQEAFQILQDAGHNADVVHFTLGLRSCVSAAAWQAAVSTLPWVARLRVSPDQHFFGSALTVCGRAARWREALAILSLNSVPSLVTHSAAMTACEKAGKWQMVLGMLYHLPMLRLQPDRRTVHASCDLCLAVPSDICSLTFAGSHRVHFMHRCWPVFSVLGSNRS